MALSVGSAPARRQEVNWLFGGNLLNFLQALKFMEDHSRVQVDAMEKIGDRDAYRVVGTRPDGSAIDRLYFDVQTGLLLRSYTTMQSVLGSFPEETNYDDYRVVSGIKVPSPWES